jgi:hypothetical protein
MAPKVKFAALLSKGAAIVSRHLSHSFQNPVTSF